MTEVRSDVMLYISSMLPVNCNTVTRTMNLVQTKGNPNYGGMVTIRPRLVQLRHRTSIAIETVRRASGDSIKEISVMNVAGRRAIDSQAHNF